MCVQPDTPESERTILSSHFCAALDDSAAARSSSMFDSIWVRSPSYIKASISLAVTLSSKCHACETSCSLCQGIGSLLKVFPYQLPRAWAAVRDGVPMRARSSFHAPRLRPISECASCIVTRSFLSSRVLFTSGFFRSFLSYSNPLISLSPLLTLLDVPAWMYSCNIVL